jgi:hypothetical protein
MDNMPILGTFFSAEAIVTIYRKLADRNIGVLDQLRRSYQRNQVLRVADTPPLLIRQVRTFGRIYTIIMHAINRIRQQLD